MSQSDHQNITAADIAAILREEGCQLDERQVVSIRAFVQEVGGLAQAQQAVECLGELQRAA